MKTLTRALIVVALTTSVSLLGTPPQSRAQSRPLGTPAETTADVPQIQIPERGEASIKCQRVIRADLVDDTAPLFGDDVAVTRPSQSSAAPAMAARANGEIYLVTDDLNENALDIFRSTNGGNSWIYHASLVGDEHLLTPSIAIGEGVANRLLVTYHYGKGTPSSSIIVYWEDLDTGANGSSVLITSPAPFDPLAPAICVDSPDYADWYPYVTYSWDAPIPAPDGVYVTQFMRSLDLGTTWIDLQTLQLSPGDVRTSDIDFAGQALVATYAHERAGGSDADVSARISTDFGVTWGAAIPLGRSNLDETWPSVAVANAGLNMVVAYTVTLSPDDSDIEQYSSVDGGTNWTWGQWPRNDLPEFNCDLVEDPRNGGIHGAFWRQNSGAAGFTMHLRSLVTDPTTWLDLNVVCDTGEAVPWGRPVVCVDPVSEREEEACLAWGDFRGDPMRRVYFDGPRVREAECAVVPFEDLTVGSAYVPGDNFASHGVDISVGDFYYVVGTCGPPTTSGEVRVMDVANSCRTGKELWIDNVTLAFDFHEPAYQVTIPFGEFGGTVDLGVNGDCRVVPGFSTLDNATVGGCLVSVIGLGSGCGELTLEGPVEQLVIGGQELAIDDIQYCRRMCENLTITMDFEALPLGAELHHGARFAHGYSELTPPSTGYAVETTVDTYYWGSGCTDPYTGGYALVQDAGDACASGRELWVNNVNLRFDFDGAVERLTILYGEYGGNINLELNGVCVEAGSFPMANGPYPDAYFFAESYPATGGCGRIVVNGKIHEFAIGGQELAIDSIEACLHPVVGVLDPDGVSVAPRLWNAPNPFRTTTVIRFDTPLAGDVSLDIFDVVGRRVRSLLGGETAEATRDVTWDARDDDGRRVPPGVYFYRVTSDRYEATRQMVVIE